MDMNFRKSSVVVTLLLAVAGCKSMQSHKEAAEAKPVAIPLAPLEKPADPFFANFYPAPAPKPAHLVLKKGDRLAIIGDSITEQKMYSRIMETYLTVCAPELGVSVRQFGWGGETATGFLARMTNDCLRFNPTIVTTCYGMNDHRYRPYEDAIGDLYRDKQMDIVESFKSHNVAVVLGSPGPVSVGERTGNANIKTNSQALNLNLCTLRNIDVQIANVEQVGFADVFWPMLVAGRTAQIKYGQGYSIAGADGIHPGWAGHLVMAAAFLEGLGLDGEIGSLEIDLANASGKASPGHVFIKGSNGKFQFLSTRYPFYIPADNERTNTTLASGATLIPFQERFNRFTLKVKNPQAARYQIVWGNGTNIYSSAQLTRGINLAEEFKVNPFVDHFKKVDAAVAAKQAFETTQIKTEFHKADFKKHEEEVVAKTEIQRAGLVDAIHKAFVPVTHTFEITAVRDIPPVAK
ncbi:MAG: hypothetical protein JWN25_1040 [Verrucomicrobiales bacterium]|nr:hypothetical protein [Verrucomicrobiales bacterium]